MAEPNEFRMPLGQHLDELRRRMIYALLGLLPIIAAALYYGRELLAIILRPAEKALREGGQGELQQTGFLETFGAYMRVSILATIVVGSPWLLYQLWRFIAPGLHKHERRFVYFLLPLSVILTTSGVIFLFLVVLPLMLSFLVDFGSSISTREPPISTPLPAGVVLPIVPVLTNDPPLEGLAPGSVWINETIQKVRVALPSAVGVEPGVVPYSIDLYKETGIRQQYRISEVLSMILTLIMAFAGAFQAPIVVLLLGWAGIVDRAFLAKYRRHAYFACFILAAAVMPGDPASMMAMVVPLILLYELGGLLLLVFPAHRVAGTPGGAGKETTEDEDDRP